MSQIDVLKRMNRGGKPRPTDVLFAHERWIVTVEGLYCPSHGYSIEARLLGAQENGMLLWLLHALRKAWTKPRLLLRAFATACRAHNVVVEKDVRARTRATIRKELAGRRLWPVAAAKVYPQEAQEWASGRRLTYSPDELIEISREVDRMIGAEGGHSRRGPA